jgi:hypothetical protein
VARLIVEAEGSARTSPCCADDFIITHTRHGYDDDEDLILWAEDVATSRATRVVKIGVLPW